MNHSSYTYVKNMKEGVVKEKGCGYSDLIKPDDLVDVVYVFQKMGGGSIQIDGKYSEKYGEVFLDSPFHRDEGLDPIMEYIILPNGNAIDVEEKDGEILLCQAIDLEVFIDLFGLIEVKRKGDF